MIEEPTDEQVKIYRAMEVELNGVIFKYNQLGLNSDALAVMFSQYIGVVYALDNVSKAAIPTEILIESIYKGHEAVIEKIKQQE